MSRGVLRCVMPKTTDAKQRKQNRGAEVREIEGHCFFPMAMW